MKVSTAPQRTVWPALPFAEWKETCATLHMWTQIVGKIRLSLTPWTNHSWHVTLYVTSRGLTTSPIPSASSIFQIDFDFIEHVLRIQSDNGLEKIIRLAPKSVSAFYAEVMRALGELNLPVEIKTTPNEVDPAIPFEKDEKHAAYDPEYANRFWRVLLQSDRVFKEFRADFCGKCSPVHFFWGSFDLAVTRFSGRRAPQHPGGVPHLPDSVAREAYSHEVISFGFWFGDDKPDSVAAPAFYSYTAPKPDGLGKEPLQPEKAFWTPDGGMALLMYDDIRELSNPRDVILDFLESAYQAGAKRANWPLTDFVWRPS